MLVNACWSLAALPNGDVWYGYYNTPAFALIRPAADGAYTIRQFRTSGEVRDAESPTFDTDQRGWLWRGGMRGISISDSARAEAGQWLYLDQSDGLSGEGINSGSFFSDADGSVWLGSDISIFHYLPPQNLLSPSFAPRIFLSSFSLNGAPPKMADAVHALPYGSKIVAHIGSLQFDRRHAMRLRYRILSDRAAWRELSNLDLPLDVLTPGSHRLEVQARLFTGPWSPSLATTLTVLPPVWRTWPWLLSYGLAAAGLAGFAHMWRRHQVAIAIPLLPDLAPWRLGAFAPEVHEVSSTVLDSRFEVGGLLARGGFANVMEGYDLIQKQRCAIKLFRSEIRDNDWIQRQFGQEVAALQKVRHSNVVAIYAHGRSPSGTPYLVMEFVEGRSLREVLNDGALKPSRVAKFLRQLSSALDTIHLLGICHRDVKPENVIIRNEGLPEEDSVLIDFSIAIVKDANETLHGLSRAAGTFDYMAPEQAIGYAEPSSDVYSLAKLILEMLTARRLSQLLPRASIDLPARLLELLPGLDLGLSEESIQILAKSLRFDPSQRPRAAGELARPLVRDLESDSDA